MRWRNASLAVSHSSGFPISTISSCSETVEGREVSLLIVISLVIADIEGGGVFLNTRTILLIDVKFDNKSFLRFAENLSNRVSQIATTTRALIPRSAAENITEGVYLFVQVFLILYIYIWICLYVRLGVI